MKDNLAAPESDILNTHPKSVISGKTVEEMEQNPNQGITK